MVPIEIGDLGPRKESTAYKILEKLFAINISPILSGTLHQPGDFSTTHQFGERYGKSSD
jgi:hypothetical protein